MTPLLRAFREACAESGAAEAPLDDAGLDLRLEALFARGRAAHPRLQVPASAFGRCLAVTVDKITTIRLEALAIEDLYLACACSHGVPGAAAAFENRCVKIIRRAVSRVLPGSADREDAEQRTRRALLVGDDGSPKIATYLGHGPLENWVAVTAIRVAVSFGRSESAERRLREKATAEAARGFDPEAIVIKGELRRELEAAIEAALQRLEDRERLVLRLYLVSGMTLAAIGKTFDVTQPTVSRWLVRARQSVLDDVRRELGGRLRVANDDLASIANLVASQLDISISRVLGTV
jgi:RNA polymerase sigma-70 factor (ECF subfamily)